MLMAGIPEYRLPRETSGRKSRFDESEWWK